MNLLNYLNGYILYPVLEKASKRSISPKLKTIKKFDSLSPEEKQSFRQDSFFKILEHCRDNIPYYQEIFKKHNFKPELIKKDFRYIQDLPILTKEIVRKELERLKLPTAIHARKTGGSTGQSAWFYYDNEGLDWTSAINLRSYEYAGKKPHHPDTHISAELNHTPPLLKQKIIQQFKLRSQNRSVLMINSFDDKSLAVILKNLRSFRPYLLQGHPSTAYAIADYIERNGIKINRKLCSIFEPSGEMLTPKIINAVEKNLKCKVVNRYGNAEFGVMAHSIAPHNPNKLKIFDFAFHVEECEESNLIVSGFTNFGMPLLRYDTGDIGTVRVQNSEHWLSEIKGRAHESVPIDDKIFPTHYIMDFLDHKVTGVREFQIELHKKGPVLKIVPENKSRKKIIKDSILNRWPSGIEVDFIEFKDLQTQGWRNKFKYIIDKREQA